MKRTILLLVVLLQFSFLQAQQTKVDTLDISKIKNEALNNPKAMETLSYLCNVFGSRLMWSPQYKNAAEWIAAKLKEWNISKVYFEDIDKRGKSWTIKKCYANMVEPYTLPLISNPKCWSPGTNGIVKGEAIYMKADRIEDLEQYKGKLNGKIVFISAPAPARFATKPLVVRFTDDSLNVLSGASIPGPEEKKQEKEFEEQNNKSILEYLSIITKKVEMCKNEGAALIIDNGSRLYGTNIAWANISATPSKNIFDFLIDQAGDPDIPESVPQIVIAAEQYNCIIDIIQKNKRVTLEADLEVDKGGVENGFSVIAEIPGTDLKDEIVMLGGHLDSYTSANGVVDNGTGVVASMEALRIIKSLGLQPRRTIRVALWGAEEEGLLGSKYHIKKHFESGKEKLCAYFNMDFGVGRFRGIYAEENKGAAELFKEWIKILNDPKFKTVCLSSVKNSDQEAFFDAGLPGFAFIQDPLDYGRTYHTNMDFIERVPKEDFVQNIFTMAAFAWMAANLEGDFPVK
jgi:carboxypeptidase Q